MGGLFVEQLFSAPWHFLAWTLIVVFSICVHEYAHARVALWRGDDTAAARGHLTLNPLVQMGWLSIVALLILGFAWGAVPVRPERFRRRGDAALVSFSGPAANLLLCLAAALGFGLSAKLSAGPGAAAFFSLAARANAVLFVLNLLPAPMLDGWSVFALFLPVMEDWRARYGPTLSWIAMLVIFATPLSDVVWSAGDGLAGALLKAFR